MASRNIPLYTIQAARFLGQRALHNYRQVALLNWTEMHARPTSTEQSVVDGFNVAYDLRNIPRYVLLYFDGKDANDIEAASIVAMEAYNLSDNMLSEAFRDSLWRTFMPYPSDTVSMANSAIAATGTNAVSYNVSHDREQRGTVRSRLHERGYKRMMQFIFNNDGSISRII